MGRQSSAFIFYSSLVISARSVENSLRSLGSPTDPLATVRGLLYVLRWASVLGTLPWQAGEHGRDEQS